MIIDIVDWRNMSLINNMTKEKKLFIIMITINKLRKPIITIIQKTLLIFKEEYKEDTFVYTPCNFGANSFELDNLILYLVNHGFVRKKTKEKNELFSITIKGKNIIKQIEHKYSHEHKILKQLIEIVNSWTFFQLIAYVYKFYPEYTKKSLIIDNIDERINDDWITNANGFKKQIRKIFQ